MWRCTPLVFRCWSRIIGRATKLLICSIRNCNLRDTESTETQSVLKLQVKCRLIKTKTQGDITCFERIMFGADSKGQCKLIMEYIIIYLANRCYIISVSVQSRRMCSRKWSSCNWRVKSSWCTKNWSRRGT